MKKTPSGCELDLRGDTRNFTELHPYKTNLRFFSSQYLSQFQEIQKIKEIQTIEEIQTIQKIQKQIWKYNTIQEIQKQFRKYKTILVVGFGKYQHRVFWCKHDTEAFLHKNKSGRERNVHQTTFKRSHHHCQSEMFTKAFSSSSPIRNVDQSSKNIFHHEYCQFLEKDL